MTAQTQLPLSETLASEMSLFQLDETLSLLMESATEEAPANNGEIDADILARTGLQRVRRRTRQRSA